MTSEPSVERLFNPRSIALFGATDKSRWSLYTFNNLASFPGDVYCINRRSKVVHDQPAFADIADVPATVDLAYLMVPTTVVRETLEKAANAGVRSAVVLTAGFAEVSDEGRALQDDVVALCQERGISMLGPNGNGYLNFTASTLPYGLPATPRGTDGSVGVVLQSGALASAILTLAEARNIGLSKLVSMGNEAMVTMTDVVDYLIDDPSTTSIALFIESIRKPDEFIRVARKARAAGKPIVALKVGRSEKSASTALAHTGSLVGSDSVIDAVFQQCDVVRVQSIEELIMTAGLLAQTGVLRGNRGIFVTPSGGACDIIADRCEDEGIALLDFSSDVRTKLHDLVPSYAHVNNPLDVTGYVVVDSTLLPNALRIAVSEPQVDFVVCVNEAPRLEPPRPELLEQSAGLIAEAVSAADVPVFLMSNSHTDLTPYGREFIARTGIPTPLGGIHLSLSALGHAVRWSAGVRAGHQSNAPEPEPIEVPLDATGVWSEGHAATFLDAHGIPMAPHEIVTDAELAVVAAQRLGFPVVAKMASNAVAHKSDVGGVLVGLEDEAAVRDAFALLQERARALPAGDASGDGVLLAQMRSGGVELIVGMTTDPQWGQVLAVGLGGVWVEVLADTVLRRLPITLDDATQMISQLRGAALLNGFRGSPAADISALAAVIHRFAQLAGGLRGRISEMEINPLFVRGDQIEGLDALMTWTTSEGAPHAH